MAAGEHRPQGGDQAAIDLPGASGIPVWSPDGQGIATNTDSGALNVMDLDGNVLASIEGVGGHLAWQPLDLHPVTERVAPGAR